MITVYVILFIVMYVSLLACDALAMQQVPLLLAVRTFVSVLALTPIHPFLCSC